MDSFMDHSETDHVTGHKPSWTRLHKPVWRCYPGGVEISYNTPATISKAYDKLGCEDYCTALILSLAIIINSLLRTTAERRPLPLTSNRLCFQAFCCLQDGDIGSDCLEDVTAQWRVVFQCSKHI